MEKDALRTVVTDFLNNHRKAVFATVDKEGGPHTSLMLYVVDGDLNVYFGTRRAFGKYEQLKQNPHMSLSVIEEKLDPLRVVDIRGKAEEIAPDEHDMWFEHFKAKNTSKYYVEGADDFVMFRVRPTMIRWLDATSGELEIVPVL